MPFHFSVDRPPPAVSKKNRGIRQVLPRLRVPVPRTTRNIHVEINGFASATQKLRRSVTRNERLT